MAVAAGSGGRPDLSSVDGLGIIGRKRRGSAVAKGPAIGIEE